jgi:peroxiredoxin
MIKTILLFAGMLTGFFAQANDNPGCIGFLERPDSVNIIFRFYIRTEKDKPLMYIINNTETIRVEDIRFTKDSVFIHMPVFESFIQAAILKEGGWQGIWTKGGSAHEQVMKFEAWIGRPLHDENIPRADFNVTGRWAVSFASDKSAAYPSVAEFKQVGNKLTGTFLNPTGDYRYLQGEVSGNRLWLSTFDGAHAFLFTATVLNGNIISDGKFYSGKTYKEGWNAVKDANAKVNSAAVAMAMRPGEERLNFRFPDLNGKPVSINDEQFKNKVVIIQIMGSWCPNCMDETVFLSDYYNKNKQRGVEIISLAYEYSTDFDRSVKSIKKFQQRFNVQYPMLVTGVTVSDSLRTEKTLPQVTPIKFFPSSIIIDKKGIVRKFDTGFVGPGTGKHYADYKKEFYLFMDKLLNEK